MYLVDANVLSEATKPSPNLKVVEWLRANEAELAVDPIILGEIRFGIDRMPPGKHRKRFELWFAEGIENLVCLPIDAAAGMRWAQLLAKLRAFGSAMPFKDIASLRRPSWCMASSLRRATPAISSGRV